MKNEPDNYGRMKSDPDDRMNGEKMGGVRPGILPLVGGGGAGMGGDFGGTSVIPSRVLQVQRLMDNTMEADLVDALSHFGPVR